jgi:feruloyl esterase
MKAALVICASLPVLFGAAGTPCGKLTEMTIPNVTIRSAATIEPVPGAANPLPAFCRVEAVAHPVPDSEIEFEVWMPSLAAWNGKFEGVGNGGYSGALGLAAMTQAVRNGYATASHNTGHPGDSLKFGQGHPEKVIDYAYRAVHVMTENARLIVRAHMGRFAEKSYFAGCSAGGHQALSEAQRYPDDYDGIVAGAPASNRIAQTFGFLWSWQALHRADGSLVIDKTKLALVTKAVVDACDAADGLKDGLVSDPRRCTPPDLTQILTGEEAAAVRKVWAGARSPTTGERIFTGWPMGSENSGDQGWDRYLMDPPEPMRVELFRYFLFHDPNWDWRTINWDRDLAYAQRKLGFMNAISADLSGFKKRGGKLIMYAGWADPIVPPEDTVAYFEKVTETMGNPQDFLRFFMAPGMGHCGGGPGPNSFDTLGSLDQWVTGGTAPTKLIASHRTKGAVDRTRPLCPYPQVAQYSGAGSIDDAANFTCVNAK